MQVHVWDSGIFYGRPLLSPEGASTQVLAISTVLPHLCVVLLYIAVCLLSSFFL